MWVRRLGAALAITATLLTGCGALHGPTQQEMIRVIQQDNPEMRDANGDPTFDITKVVEPLDGWYVATLRMRTVDAEPNKVVFRQEDDRRGSLRIVAGPGTSFPPGAVSLPDEVRELLPTD